MLKLIKESKKLDVYRLDNMIEQIRKSIDTAKTFEANYKAVDHSIENLEKVLSMLVDLKKNLESDGLLN